MSPITTKVINKPKGFPRPRGDEPPLDDINNWDLLVFPAHAGMSPRAYTTDSGACRFPRPRGDEPPGVSANHALRAFSPPTRG